MAWLEFQHLSKSFPGVRALQDVSFGLPQGGCHALMGENGAGKSTLGKILSGVYRADQGQITIDGQPASPATPLDARRLGIAIVHQELAFCPNLTVAENLCLGNFPRKFGFVRRAEMRRRAAEMLSQIDAPINLSAPIGGLSTGQEQMVQIAAALGLNARIIVMDEPTSSLSAGEAAHLFALIHRLKERGITIIYVSHRMEEIFKVCDTVTVLRDGRHIVTEPISQTTPERLVAHMIGRSISTENFSHLAQPLGPPLLEVSNLCSPGKFRDISFSLHQGEVLGLAGLVGAGRSEIAAAIFGLDPAATGTIKVRGQSLPLGQVSKSLRHGLGFLPEDRKRLGLVLSLNCRENTSLAALPELARAGFVRRPRERSVALDMISRLSVKTPHMDSPISGLSGGNQQKLALAKWLARGCDLLLLDEPTRGVDVGAKSEMHRLIDQLATRGAAVLLISSELPELLALSRRALVLREGLIMGELSRAELSERAVMRLMSGLKTSA